MDLLSEWQQGLDPRESDILTHRLLKLGPGRRTLDEIGQAHGVTRERVRQLESRLLTRFREKLAQPRFRAVRWALFQLESGLGAFAPETEVPLDGDSTDAGAFRLLLHVSGYVHDAELAAIRRSDFRLPQSDALPLVDKGPILDEARLDELLTQDGVARQHLPFAIQQIAGIRRLEGSLVLWPRNIARKGVAVLALRRRPMTTDEIADVIDEDFNRRGFRDRVFNEPRVMRSSRHHVALREWELPEYGGVVPAMIERLGSGPAVLSDLAQDLSMAFQISPNSVMMYSAAPVFRTHKGMIELRPADDPFVPTNAPETVAGLYRLDTDRLAWHVRVDHDVLRGSGRAVPDEIGVFLAGAPPLSLQLKNTGKDIAFTWAQTSHVGPSIGSFRELALAAGSHEGDLLRLVFDRTDHSVTAHVVHVSPGGEPGETLARLTGLGEQHLASQTAFAGAVSASDGALVELLRSRGDEAVADLVDMLPSH
nr:sigma factor-like helix-turn-helix DNA-binding protein [Janibacter cremeus]